MCKVPHYEESWHSSRSHGEYSLAEEADIKQINIQVQVLLHILMTYMKKKNGMRWNSRKIFSGGIVNNYCLHWPWGEWHQPEKVHFLLIVRSLEVVAAGMGSAGQVQRSLFHLMFSRWLLECQPLCMYSRQKARRMGEQKGTLWFSIPLLRSLLRNPHNFCLSMPKHSNRATPGWKGDWRMRRWAGHPK